MGAGWFSVFMTPVGGRRRQAYEIVIDRAPRLIS